MRRYIRLTNLIPELLDLVDQKKISFNPAVELSYLTAAEQRGFLEAMQDTQKRTVPFPQAQAHQEAEPGRQSAPTMPSSTSWERKRRPKLDRVTIKTMCLRKYFPKSYTPKQMQDTIIKLLEQWQKKRQRSQNADRLASITKYKEQIWRNRQ